MPETPAKREAPLDAGEPDLPPASRRLYYLSAFNRTAQILQSAMNTCYI